MSVYRMSTPVWLTHSMSSRCKHVHVIIPFETEFRLRTTLQALQGRRGEQLHAAVESERIYVRIQPFLSLSLSLSNPSAFHSKLQWCHVCCGACLSLVSRCMCCCGFVLCLHSGCSNSACI